MEETSGLAGDDGLPWPSVARAAGELRKLGLIDWTYNCWPDESGEPPAHLIDDRNLQRVVGIMLTADGHSALAARKSASATTTVERALDQLDAPPEVKTEARGVLGRMRQAGASVGTGAVAEVLAAAVRRALGLP